MFKKLQPSRTAKCRSCDGNIPAQTDAYHIANVGYSYTKVFMCMDCVMALIADVASGYESYEALGQEIVMKKLTTQK